MLDYVTHSKNLRPLCAGQSLYCSFIFIHSFYNRYVMSTSYVPDTSRCWKSNEEQDIVPGREQTDTSVYCVAWTQSLWWSLEEAETCVGWGQGTGREWHPSLGDQCLQSKVVRMLSVLVCQNTLGTKREAQAKNRGESRGVVHRGWRSRHLRMTSVFGPGEIRASEKSSWNRSGVT